MIFLGSDHRGFALKEKIKTWLDQAGLEFVDCGPASYEADDDYPDYVAVVAQKVAEDPLNHRGIVLGATGQGEAIVANRRRGVRAAVFYGGPLEIVRLARLHNAANVLALGAAPGDTIAEGQPLEDDVAQQAVQIFLKTEFLDEPRHLRRLAKIDPQ